MEEVVEIQYKTLKRYLEVADSLTGPYAIKTFTVSDKREEWYLSQKRVYGSFQSQTLFPSSLGTWTRHTRFECLRLVQETRSLLEDQGHIESSLTSKELIERIKTTMKEITSDDIQRIQKIFSNLTHLSNPKVTAVSQKGHIDGRILLWTIEVKTPTDNLEQWILKTGPYQITDRGWDHVIGFERLESLSPIKSGNLTPPKGFIQTKDEEEE